MKYNVAQDKMPLRSNFKSLKLGTVGVFLGKHVAQIPVYKPGFYY